MPKFNIDVAHDQERSAVVEKLQSFLQTAISDKPDVVSDIEESWDDQGNLNFSFSAMGFRVAGKVVTDNEKVNASGDLPFAAMPFRGALENQLKEKLKEAIA